MKTLLERAVVPSRLALIQRNGETLGYNPELNTWARLEADTAELLRWLRAGRTLEGLVAHLARRFAYSEDFASSRVQAIIKWSVLRRLLYLDRQALEDTSAPAAILSTVYWISTQACNLRCKYCYQDATVARAQELTTSEAKGLVDQAVEAGAEVFIFTGGEPFARRDLLEIAEYSRNCKLITNVITNGHYITKNTISSVAATFDTVTISVDHGIPEHHDQNRGPGSWLKAVTAVELLLDAGVDVDVNSVLTRHGLKDVKDLLHFGAQRPIGQHRIVPQFPMGRCDAASGDALTPDELLNLNDVIHRLNKELDGGAKRRLKTEGDYTKKMNVRQHCGAGLSEVSVDPEGWVYPCKPLQYQQFKADNIRDKRLVDICKNHAALQHTRKMVVNSLRPCRTCIIKNHCGGGCRGIHFSFTKEYAHAHPLFCAFLRNSFEVQAWAGTGEVPPRRRPGSFNTPSQLPYSNDFVPLSVLEGQ
jgi:radical SAM protein with 4Fe4S-binding SPASM domain